MVNDEQTHIHCVMTYICGTKIWLADIEPIAVQPHLLRETDTDIAIGYLQELSLPRDFRRNIPSYMKHYYNCIASSPLDSFFLTLFRRIVDAYDLQKGVMLYARSPTVLTCLWISCLIRGAFLNPRLLYYDFFTSIPKTRETWTLSLFDYVRTVYPLADLEYDQVQQLYAYEKMHMTLHPPRTVSPVVFCVPLPGDDEKPADH